jgi:hypothetical protein
VSTVSPSPLPTSAIILYQGGSIKLASSNPFTAPPIDPTYITTDTDFDIFTLNEVVKIREATRRLARLRRVHRRAHPGAGEHERGRGARVVCESGCVVAIPSGGDGGDEPQVGVVDPDLKVRIVDGRGRFIWW